MRILHLTRDFPPRACGGISTAVGGLAHASRRTGVAVSVLSFDAWRPRGGARPGDAVAAPTDEHGISRLRVAHPGHLAAAHQFAAAARPDVLHVHHGMLWPFAAALRDTLGAPAVKTVHVVHRQMNALRGTGERTASLVAQEIAMAAADRLIFPSHAAAALALGRPQPSAAAGSDVWPGPAAAGPGSPPQTVATGRVVIAPHGIDDDDFARAAVAQARRPLLLAVGRFDDVKGTPELFAVLPEILRRVVSASAVVAGGLPANLRAEARWRTQWEAAAPAELRARVAFPGWLAADALRALYADAAVVVIPSRFETFGLAALESMLHGTPVAATAAGALPELITHGETGLLSPVGDVASLAEHVVELLRDAELARRLGRAAAADVRARWLWSQRLPAVRDVYTALATTRPQETSARAR